MPHLCLLQQLCSLPTLPPATFPNPITSPLAWGWALGREKWESKREWGHSLLSIQLLSKPKFSGVEKIKTIGSTYMAATGLNATSGQDAQQVQHSFLTHHPSPVLLLVGS